MDTGQGLPLRPAVIRVASVPAAHPYVQHLARATGPDPVRRLPDPPPRVSDPLPGQWWPPRMLEPDWITDHHDEVDLVHLHFGFDDADPARLRQWTAALDRHRLPLVLTVHDLINPHVADRRRHLEQLGVLVPAAAEVITLTAGAAAEIEQRWGRRALVIPHPHVVPLPRMDRKRLPHKGFVIGVHAKNRANLDPLPVLRVLLETVVEQPDTVVRVDGAPSLLEPAGWAIDQAEALGRWLAEHRDHPQLQVKVHDRFTDDQLWDYLGALDLCVLPYAFGTHSGWLEACVDLGTGVLVPATGYYADQHGHPRYRLAGAGPIPSGVDELADAVRAIRADPDLARPARPDRGCQREHVAAEHERIYRGVLARA